MILNHIAINVSSEAGVNFYKKLGFEETAREALGTGREKVLLKGLFCSLEITKDSTFQVANRAAHSCGISYLCFQVESLDFVSDKKALEKNTQENRFVVLKDPDGLLIKIIEVKPQPPEGNYSFEAGI